MTVTKNDSLPLAWVRWNQAWRRACLYEGSVDRRGQPQEPRRWSSGNPYIREIRRAALDYERIKSELERKRRRQNGQ